MTTERTHAPATAPGTVTDQLDVISQLLGDVVTQLERIADVMEQVAPRDLTTKDKRYLRVYDVRE